MTTTTFVNAVTLTDAAWFNDADALIYDVFNAKATAGTSGTIIRSNGTNLVNTTATYPTTATANRLIYASGSNVIGESAANLTYDGTTLSVTTLAGALNLSDGQLAFPASQNASAGANVLDDYEEGTWTPAVTFGGAAVGVTYSVQVGTYTKIGRLVNIHFQVALSSKGSSVGILRITALPFTINSDNAVNGVGSLLLWANTVTAFIGMAASADNNSTQLNVRGWAAATQSSASDNVSDTDVGDTLILNGKFTYYV